MLCLLATHIVSSSLYLFIENKSCFSHYFLKLFNIIYQCMCLALDYLLFFIHNPSFGIEDDSNVIM